MPPQSLMLKAIYPAFFIKPWEPLSNIHPAYLMLVINTCRYYLIDVIVGPFFACKQNFMES